MRFSKLIMISIRALSLHTGEVAGFKSLSAHCFQRVYRQEQAGARQNDTETLPLKNRCGIGAENLIFVLSRKLEMTTVAGNRGGAGWVEDEMTTWDDKPNDYEHALKATEQLALELRRISKLAAPKRQRGERPQKA